MAAINIGTSTSANATSDSSQRKLLKTSTGILVLFALVDGHVKYQTSTDNGASWNGSWIVAYNTQTVAFFDVKIDTNDDIILVFGWSSVTHSFRKLTYSTGTWSNGTVYDIGTISSTSNQIVRRANGDIWWAYSGNTPVYANYSTNEGVNWTGATLTPGASLAACELLAVGSDIWLFSVEGTALKLYKYTSSWSTATTIAASGIVTANILSVIKISDSEIYVAVGSGDYIKVYKFDGASWDSGTQLSSIYAEHPYLISVDSKPVLLYVQYTSSTDKDIVYRKWNGSSWDAEVALTSGTTKNIYPSAVESDLEYIYVEYTTGTASPYTIYFDKKSLNPTHTKTILSDTKIKAIDIQKTITSDAYITSLVTKAILSDAKIKAIGVEETILSDAKIIDQYLKTITSNSKIKATGIPQTITSNAKIAIQVLSNINQKFNSVLQILYNVNNKFNSVISNLSDVNNIINTVKAIISDINNDFRTKKLILNNINNDIRFLCSWQKAADNSLQSLGKEYIKVYIATVEQTDVDVNSIDISKDLDSAHTASFDLGRAYDSTKPTMESVVEIKYNNFVLFSGYITQIAPAGSPEKMRINCQDEYWKQNKSNVYYHVGHRPSDDKELYYNTLKTALLTEHFWSLNIGDFIPQTVDNFAVGKSDAITNLIQECGNYGWFYDVDGIKKLCTAGDGSIINIKRQSLGLNIGLYDLITHSFSENAEDIINKLRVQMGEKIIRKFDSSGGDRTYTGYNYSSYNQFVTPAWDSSLELSSNQTGSGYGIDHQNPSLAGNYKDVFTKYTMPYLDPKLSSWSDRFAPIVEIYSSGPYSGFIGPLNLQLEKELKDGFTIDYEKGTITFNEPYYIYQTDAKGERTSMRAPIIRVKLWKKDYYTYTLDPTDDPETDISNPLMFFTSKMGSYPTTIIKDLNLSNLSIQVGGQFGTEFIPSWDDTNFAKDYADWQLSKSCDSKIKGNIELTLDAVCFYGIDLTKRIYISGITDTAMNIVSMSYNISNFTVTLSLENSRIYQRTENYQSHGE